MAALPRASLIALVCATLTTAVAADAPAARDLAMPSGDPIAVTYADRFVDTEIRAATLAALSSEPSTDRVHVDVTNGTARLTGTVDDADAAIAAVHAARAAGARSVVNDLDRLDLDR